MGNKKTGMDKVKEDLRLYGDPGESSVSRARMRAYEQFGSDVPDVRPLPEPVVRPLNPAYAEAVMEMERRRRAAALAAADNARRARVAEQRARSEAEEQFREMAAADKDSGFVRAYDPRRQASEITPARPEQREALFNALREKYGRRTDLNYRRDNRGQLWEEYVGGPRYGSVQDYIDEADNDFFGGAADMFRDWRK